MIWRTLDLRNQTNRILCLACASMTNITTSKSFSFSVVNMKDDVWRRYNKLKHLCMSKRLPADVDPDGVFATCSTALSRISTYGFDYDYTLANYSLNLSELIYLLGRDILIKKFKYPEELMDYPVLTNFFIRGLHYDISHGLFMKVDSFSKIQRRGVYRGTRRVSSKEVTRIFGEIPRIPHHRLEGGITEFAQLSDFFAISEMSLLANTADMLAERGIQYHPEILYTDVSAAIGRAHPLMHEIVAECPAPYVRVNPLLPTFLERLHQEGKNVFLLTNSPFFFVKIDTMTHYPSWKPVSRLEKNHVYIQGDSKSLQNIMNWQPGQIIYFGDHPYADLADVHVLHGWRAGAIVPELKREILVTNSDAVKRKTNWLQALTNFYEEEQSNLQYDLKAREQILDEIYHMRYCDIYTASITNLLNYSINHTFQPRRGALPHEFKYWFM
ncbi:unnamed protein product [Cyprideis torosa]|uniref:Uncharacterized protein n=1 Tax=Cyprideis torosa TaxID=163714 RepID=A0A7R8WB51_9CRUS|nr:unnamed protein product [Cyprideis torosa]CAG0887023.1 unnamed protein product [Cyprideis torosa]